eukprot:TRINITY_DN2795_c0_g2_i3.p1 TRINITY_DN2795_c0_g2~~TRINITY_DN2795_c0_g2_i3.p1  ORF type:complete len:409 (+),score=31.64 TRINITY_DN2795_c0_g2_i3:893-2119(+)
MVHFLFHSDISGNYINITNDRVCNQIPIWRACRYTPMRPAPMRTQRSNNIAVLRGKRLQAEFQDYTFQFYALLPNGSTYRDEYFEFVWSDFWQGARGGLKLVQSFQIQPFAPFKQLGPSVWTTNTTFLSSTGPAFYLEWFFTLDPVNSTTSFMSAIKFSVDYYMINTTYIQDDVYRFLVTNGNYVFRMPHSSPTSIIRCPSNTYCKSDEMDFQSVLQFASPLSFLQTVVETKKVRITLDFPTGCIADGRYLDVTRGEVDLPIIRYFHPLGSANYLANADNTTYVPPGPLGEQYASMDWTLFALRPLYNGTYDPGVLIELLFGDAGPSSSSPEAAAINQASTGLIIGLAVGLSLFAIAAISVTVVMVKVAPYRAKREEDQKKKVLTDVDETPLTGADQSPRWAPGAKPT